MIRLVQLMIPLLLLAGTGAAGQDFLPLDHGLKYTGRDGLRPVSVEITLREQLDGTLEYAEWVLPQGWARWLTRSHARRARLAFADQRLSVLSFDARGGPVVPAEDLPDGVLDELSIRLRVRADIARGIRSADYQVWREDGSIEEWALKVDPPESVDTPDGTYQAFKFRLGSDSEWLEGWSAPLLVFHFVRLVHWRDGRKVGELNLSDKQL